jgi:hypothetical protein
VLQLLAGAQGLWQPYQGLLRRCCCGPWLAYW